MFSATYLLCGCECGLCLYSFLENHYGGECDCSGVGTGGLCRHNYWHNLVAKNLEHNVAPFRRKEHNYTVHGCTIIPVCELHNFVQCT